MNAYPDFFTCRINCEDLLGRDYFLKIDTYPDHKVKQIIIIQYKINYNYCRHSFVNGGSLL